MNSKVLKRLLSYPGRYKMKLTLGVLMALIGTIFTIVAPKLLGNITTILYAGVSDHTWRLVKLPDGSIDPASVWSYFAGRPMGKVPSICITAIGLVIMFILSLIFCSIANRILSELVSLAVKDIRSDIDRKMHRMKLQYYDSHTNGEILSVITNDVDTINTLFSKNAYTAIVHSITLVGVLIMLITVNFYLALVAVVVIPVTFFLSSRVQKMSSSFFAAQQDLLGDVNGYVEETFDGQTVVSTFNYQLRARKHFDELNERLRVTARDAERYAAIVMPLTHLVNYIGYAVIALLGCILAMNGMMTVGGVQSAIQYANTFQLPFTTFAQMAGQFAAAMAGAGRIFAFLDAQEESPDPVKGKVPELCDGSVRFEHVKFGYTPEQPLMTDVSIAVKPGQKFAIVGPTGAGKTTLVNLLMRFYEIDGGRIWVDGVDTREMTRQELRRHFGMVLQDTWLFEGTIRDNLKYGANRDVSDEEMIAAAKAVCADSFIRMMPGGYDMVLSKGAENVSQGQRQLLTIVRAMIADPEIMILDEATSNVDAHTEQTIQNAMATLLKGRTSFVIAHRLSTIRDAHTILYMENGDIKEVGDHETLMRLNGKYAALYNSQFG